MSWTRAKETELRYKFDQLKPQLEAWGNTVDREIISLLSANSRFENSYIKLHPQHRIKEVNSFIGKAFYREKSKKYSNYLLEIEDKIGTRIVLLTTEQVYQVKEILLASNELWECKIGKDINEILEDDPQKFDYLAVHLTVQPKNGWCGLSEEITKLLTCEIQIKTLFQHAFSEVSHDTVYKGPFRHEPLLLRILARTMALMESADIFFQQMFKMIESEELRAINLLKVLTGIYKDLLKEISPQNTEAIESSVIVTDSYLYDFVVSIFRDIPAPEIADIQAYVAQNTRSLKKLILDKDFYLANQPVVILMAFLVAYYPRPLFHHWTLNIKILEELFNKLNYSTEDFYRLAS
jgi:ppGpp synthetase/RelA/SpoT-type nucleotidyltranferase